jgi:hypothetical protein
MSDAKFLITTQLIKVLVDFYFRLRRRQLVGDLTYDMPLTQRQLGDYRHDVDPRDPHAARPARGEDRGRRQLRVAITDFAQLVRLTGEPAVEMESELDLVGAEIGEAPAQIVHEFGGTRPSSSRPG